MLAGCQFKSLYEHFEVSQPLSEINHCKFLVDRLGAKTLHVVAEARIVKSKGKGVLTDAFGPHAVHVYTTDAALSKLRTVNDVLRMIIRAQAKPNARWKQPRKPE